uniref:Uncharacterized protein n=1 Tax=viral metagenome TaxID=1070528 RepID=A0A6M3J2B2_9ZZZZ
MKITKWLFLFLLIPNLCFAGSIGRQDLHNWDGTGGTSTFSRTTSGGYTVTLKDIGQVVDILMTHGGGVNYNRATINSALTAIGSTYNTAIIFDPGNWNITSGITITGNVTSIFPSGVTITPSAGATVWIVGPILAGNYPLFDTNASGSSVILTNAAVNGIVYQAWYGTGNALGIGKVPDSSGTYTVDVGGNINITGGVTFSGTITNANLPDPITIPEIRTETTITGKIYTINLTGNPVAIAGGKTGTTISGASCYGGWTKSGTSAQIGNATTEVTAIMTSAVKGMSHVFRILQDTAQSGGTINVLFEAGDNIASQTAIIAGTSKYILSGTTNANKLILTSSGTSVWEVDEVGAPTVSWD